jgi:predicted nucleotidyltransferase
MDNRPTESQPVWAATPEKIEEAVRRIVQVAHPVKIILFGSWSRGNPRAESDVDLLVIERVVENRFAELIRLNQALRGLLLAVDILVIGETDFKEWAETPGSVYGAAWREGRVIYEAA